MSDTLTTDPYKTLGVNNGCSVADVKKAYRKLVLTCHPDKTGALSASQKKEKDEQFHNVQKAHDVLTDAHERKRYDDRVQLEKLRSEFRRDVNSTAQPTTPARPPPFAKAASFSFPSRPAPNKTPTKSPTASYFDSRTTPIYEVRVPKGVYDPDVYASRYDTPRGNSRKHEERFPDTPPSNSRRSSGRVPDRIPDDIRTDRREVDPDFYDRKRNEKEQKASVKAAYQDRKKTRTKVRRNESETKRNVYMESESETESEVELFMSLGVSPRITSFKRYSDEPVRKGRVDESTLPRRPRSPSSDSNYTSALRSAHAHLRQNGTRSISDRKSHEKRPSLSKSHTVDHTPPPKPPSPPPAPPPVEVSARRSSAKRTTSSSKPTTKRNPEIVEPYKELSDDYDYEKYRGNRKEESASSRNLAKGHRAATFGGDRLGDSIPQIRRSHTSPLSNGAAQTRPSRSSKLKHSTTPNGAGANESDSDSAPSPKAPVSGTRTTRYRVKDSETEEDTKKAQVYTVVDDSVLPPRTSGARATRSEKRHEESPRAPPAEGTSTHYAGVVPRASRQREDVRSPPRRSATFDLGAGVSSKESRSRHQHSSSNEAVPGKGGRLFAEVGTDSGVTPEISFSPRVGRENIRFAEVRRGSADGALPSRTERERDRERSGEKEREREPRRGRDREHRERDQQQERGKDDYAYESPRSARRAADRPAFSGRGQSYTSVRG